MNCLNLVQVAYSVSEGTAGDAGASVGKVSALGRGGDVG